MSRIYKEVGGSQVTVRMTLDEVRMVTKLLGISSGDITADCSLWEELQKFCKREFLPSLRAKQHVNRDGYTELEPCYSVRLEEFK